MLYVANGSAVGSPDFLESGVRQEQEMEPQVGSHVLYCINSTISWDALGVALLQVKLIISFGHIVPFIFLLYFAPFALSLQNVSHCLEREKALMTHFFFVWQNLGSCDSKCALWMGLQEVLWNSVSAMVCLLQRNLYNKQQWHCAVQYIFGSRPNSFEW